MEAVTVALMAADKAKATMELVMVGMEARQGVVAAGPETGEVAMARVAIAAAGSRHRCPAATSRSSTHDCSGLSWLTALPASRGTSMRQ